MGTSRLDDKGKAQEVKSSRRNTDAKHWDGAVRSSEEVSVMGMERRDGVRPLFYKFNCQTG